MTAGSRIWIRFPIGVSHHFSGVEWADGNLTPSDPSNLVSHCLAGAKQKGSVNAFLIPPIFHLDILPVSALHFHCTYLSDHPILTLWFACGWDINEHIFCTDTKRNAAPHHGNIWMSFNTNLKNWLLQYISKYICQSVLAHPNMTWIYYHNYYFYYWLIYDIPGKLCKILFPTDILKCHTVSHLKIFTSCLIIWQMLLFLVWNCITQKVQIFNQIKF